MSVSKEKALNDASTTIWHDPNLERLMRPLVMLAFTLFTLPASAGPGDALRLYAGADYGHDDNLLRVPEDQPAFNGTRADSWWKREGGLLFDKTYSRQRVAIVAKLSKYDFDHFKQLNYYGKDLQATWFWQLGKHFEGKAGTAYEQVLAPYTDIVSNERNLRRSHSHFAEGAWRFHSSWRLRTGFQRDKYDYELFAQRYNNRTEDASEVELDYMARSANTIGLVARRVKGKYLDPRSRNSALFDDNFTQDELRTRVLWSASGTTTFDALVGYTRRDWLSFGADRTSGATGKVKAQYQPRGKMTYRAAVWRDFAPLESAVVNYTLNKGASIGAQWDATAKIKMNADAVYERRNYNVRATSVGIGDIRDAVRTSNLSATWSPRPSLQVAAGLAHQARSKVPALGTGGFTSNSLTLSASGKL